jgi:hypothetical protein
MHDDPRNSSLRTRISAAQWIRLVCRARLSSRKSAAGVRDDAADSCCRENDHVRLYLVHPDVHLDLAPQVEWVVIDGDEFAALARQPARQRRADHPTMAGNPDPAPLIWNGSSLGAIGLSRMSIHLFAPL